jgi:hypothetical protein
MIVPYTSCAYPQVLPDSMAPYLTVNSSGVNQPTATGLSGLGCGCGCAGIDDEDSIENRLTDCGYAGGKGCGVSGLTFDGTGLLGSGLFAGDVSTWGAAEYAALAFGAYMLYSIVFTTKAGLRRAQTIPGRVKTRAKKIKRGFVD